MWHQFQWSLLVMPFETGSSSPFRFHLHPPSSLSPFILLLPFSSHYLFIAHLFFSAHFFPLRHPSLSSFIPFLSSLHFCTPSFLSSLQLPFHSSSCFPVSCGLHLFPLSSLSFLFLLSLDFVGRRLFSLWTLRPWRRLLQTPGMLCPTLVSTCLPIVLSFRCLSWINVVKIYFFKRCDWRSAW